MAYFYMRPLTVINGIFLGSCLAIAVSLGFVLIAYFAVGQENPIFQAEYEPLKSSFAIFLVMTAISGASFYSLLINHRLRWVAQVLLWAGLAATGWYYWP